MNKIIEQYIAQVQDRSGRVVTCIVYKTEDGKLYRTKLATQLVEEIDGYQLKIL